MGTNIIVLRIAYTFDKIVLTYRPKWAHERLECKKWSVTTTIFEVSEAVKVQMTLPPEWCMVIVGDRKGLENYTVNEGKTGRVIYLSAQDQERLATEGVKLSAKLPWNHFGRKNLGYLYAIASGAQLIWDFDDDNSLLSTPAQIMEPNSDDAVVDTTVLQAVSKNDKLACNSFNPMPLMGAGQLSSWPRGLPLVDIKASECQADAYRVEKTTIAKNKIAVYQSLANHDPDVDAIYRLTQNLPFDFEPVQNKQSLLVPDSAFAPFNAQATLFTYEAFFMLFLPVTVHGRVSDIWRSYLGQKLLKNLGYKVVFTHAQVVQYRNVHNYLADFESERDLYLKSGKLVEYLKYNFTSDCTYSLECHFESLIISLYEHDYIKIGDVYHFQTWIRSLMDYGYKFPQLAKQYYLQSKWPDLNLFVPVHPGGEGELNKLLLRSLKFFWPKPLLKLLFLVDQELPPATRDPFAERLKKSMEENAKSVEVKFNFIPRHISGGGHDRQQLIMFWADNFTNSEYVGFLDDDTFITNHVLLEDIFDEKGRPHVWGRSNHISDGFWKGVEKTTRWTDNSDVEVMRTMNYFPVVVKTSHLKDIRSNMLKHHPEFKNFDDFFRGLRTKGYYSQFNSMHQQLWKLKNDEYNWHLEAISARDNHFKQIIGITQEMTFPKPRCALHFNYDNRRRQPKFVEDVLKRGFCYSLVKSEFDTKSEHSQLCTNAGYNWASISTTTNTDQWSFEGLDWRWDNRTVLAHVKRIALNRARSDWNEEELKLIFA